MSNDFSDTSLKSRSASAEEIATEEAPPTLRRSTRNQKAEADPPETGRLPPAPAYRFPDDVDPVEHSSEEELETITGGPAEREKRKWSRLSCTDSGNVSAYVMDYVITCYMLWTFIMH